MARGNEVKLVFAGDSTSLEKTFANVGGGAKEMAADVDSASRRMADSTDTGASRIAEGIDGSERKFRGLGDTINGTGDIMEGLSTGNIPMMAMGFADLAGGISDFAIPALKGMRTALVSGLAPALTLISAHPLIAGILAGGAIIAGLILLEKKFGLVSSAVDGLKGVFGNVWDAVKPIINGIIGGLEFIANGAIQALLAPMTLANKIPGLGKLVPDVPRVNLPRLHSGGIVPGPMGTEVLAILQAGERVTPAGGGGSDRPLIVQLVADGKIIQEILLGEQRRTGRLGFI